MNAAEYLNLPYERVLIPDHESGTYTALIREFPGCIAEGDKPAAAYANLEGVAESWIEAVLELGQEVPTPASDATYSGRVLLRLPRSIHRKAAEAAERDGTSLNQYIVVALAERLAAARADTTTELPKPS